MGSDQERALRGRNLDGGDQLDAVDHVTHEKKRNPDTELRLDDEKDTLEHDGVDVKDDSLTLADTKGMSNRG
jgi:hypothetical protein